MKTAALPVPGIVLGAYPERRAGTGGTPARTVSWLETLPTAFNGAGAKRYQEFVGRVRSLDVGTAATDTPAVEQHLHELRSKLSNRSIPVEVRQGVIEDLFSHRALESTAAIVSFLVGIGRVSDLPEIVDRFIEIAAGNRQHEVAEVRSAVALDAAQQQRLAVALSQATGKQVEVKVIVDENVLGGIVARIGDTVIDGTVRRRLAQLKERI